MKNTKFKDSGVQWLGEIPQHWEIRKLKFVAKEIISGGTPNTSKSEFWSESGKDSYLWVAIEDMTNADFIKTTKKCITKKGLENSSARIIPPYSILYSIYASLGKIAYSNKYLTTNQAILGIVTKEFYFYKYCFYSLMSLTKTLIILSNKTTQDNINLDILRNIKIPLPPLDEQRRIAEFLDKKCEKIAEFIDKKQQIISLLKEQKLALINESTCGRIPLTPYHTDTPLCHTDPLSCHTASPSCHTERSEVSKNKGVTLSNHLDSSVARSLKNDRKTPSQWQENKPYNDNQTHLKFKHSGIEWLGEIPQHWEVRKLKFVVTQRNDKAGENDFKIGLENIESQTGKFIQTDENPFDDCGIKFKAGDILFGKLRPYLAKVYLTEQSGSCVSEFLVLNAIDIDCFFLKFLMLSHKFIQIVNSATYGTKMPRTSWEFIGNLKIPLPPLDEQRRIAEFLDKKCEKIDKAISLIEQEIQAIKEYKTSLIDKAVRGGINV